MSTDPACRAPPLSGSQRISRLVLLAAALLLAAAGPAGDRFLRLDRGRMTAATMPEGTRAVVLYYGAGWCGPCRAFVPALAAAYPRLRARGVEIVFVGDDASCAASRDYARVSRMPWLLLPCDPERHRRLRALGGAALPGMVVLDAGERVRATSWDADGESRPRRLLAMLLADQ